MARSTKGRTKTRAKVVARGAKRRMSSAKKSIATKRSASSKRAPAKAPKRGKTAKSTARARKPVTAVLTSITAAVRESPVDRVARVATEVAQQATHAVSEGVDALKGLGASLKER